MIRPYLVYEITSRCTNNCIYCYNVWKQNIYYPEGELSLPQIKALFEKLLEEITPEGITLTGGEPLTHPDILEVVSFLCDKKIRVSIATNGVLLNEATTRELIDGGVDYFEISAVSINPEKYNLLTQSTQCSKVKEAVLNVKRHGAKLTITFVITKLNLAEVEEVIDFSFAFSADAVVLNRFVPGGSGLDHLSELETTQEDIESVLSIADGKSKEYSLPICITIPIESCIIDHKKYSNLNFGTCACGRKKWAIDPVGNLRICEQNPEILGNLFDKSFFELSRLEVVNSFQRNNLRADCDKCEEFARCGGGCRFSK